MFLSTATNTSIKCTDLENYELFFRFYNRITLLSACSFVKINYFEIAWRYQAEINVKFKCL